MLKKIPQRTCMGCNQKKNKKELIRIVKNSDGEVSIDKTGKMPGRGAYLCDDINCFEKAVKSRRIDKVLDIHINDDIYEKLRGVIIDK